MFLAQLAGCVVVWSGTIVLLVRRRERLYAWASSLTRGQRSAVAVGGLFLSVVVLALGMAALAGGGLRPTGLTLWAWPLIALVGATFVALQSAALAPLLLNAVTRDAPGSSDRQDSPRP